MGEVIATKPHNVTTGVIDKSVQTHEDMQSVTFTDRNGTPRTVFAHVNGPFGSPEDIVKAAEDGILHVFESHEAAIEHWSQHTGNEEYVKLLRSLTGDKQPDSSQGGGN